jgi:Fe-S-cluster containining protein
MDAKASNEFALEMEDIYRRVDRYVADRGPKCFMRGLCCRFGEFGHRLYVSEPESLFFNLRQAESGLLPVVEDACPYQSGQACTARGHRPLGCRIYFCDSHAQHWQGPAYESFHTELKAIAEKWNIPYRYQDWLSALGEMVDTIDRKDLVQAPGPLTEP